MDTACSSALVGMHLGMQHLGGHREGGTALAAAVNLTLAETTTAAAQVAGMLTLDGRCKTLDAAADGYVRRAHAPPTTNNIPLWLGSTPRTYLCPLGCTHWSVNMFFKF